MGVAVPVGLTVALLWDLLAWCIVAALLVIWRQTFGAALLYLADALKFTVDTHVGYKHTFDFGHWFRVAENAIDVWLQAEKTGLGIEIALTWHALSESWHATVRMLQWAVDETGAAFDRLEHIKLPAWAKWAAAAALPAALFGKIVAAVVAKIRPEIHKGTTVITQTFPTKVVRIVLRSAAVTLPGVLGIPHIWREIHGLTKRNLRLSQRLHRVEGLFGAAVMAAAMANALGLGKNWRCITRGNIGRAARGLCRAPTWLLDVFLLASFEAFAIADLCGLLKAEVALAEWFQPLMMELVDVDEWLIQNCGYQKAPDLTLPAISLPSGSYGVTLNGPRDVALGLAS